MKTRSRKLGLLAFAAMTFGFAFSMSAMAGVCNTCWNRCIAQFEACKQQYGDGWACTSQFTQCGKGCGCDMP